MTDDYRIQPREVLAAIDEMARGRDIPDAEYAEVMEDGDPAEKLAFVDSLGNVLDPNDIDNRLVEVPPPAVLRAYHDYFSLGPKRTIAELVRRYRKAAELYGPTSVPALSATTIGKWAKKYHWELQIRADEIALLREEQVSRQEAARKLGQNHSRAGQFLLSLGLTAMREYIGTDGQLTTKGAAEISPGEARRMILEGAKLEREMFTFAEEELESELDEELSYS